MTGRGMKGGLVAAIRGVEEIESAVDLAYELDPPAKLWPRKTRGRNALRERRLDPYYVRGLADGASAAQKTIDADPELVPRWLEAWPRGERPPVEKPTSAPIREEEFAAAADYEAGLTRYFTGWLKGYVMLCLQRLLQAGLAL